MGWPRGLMMYRGQPSQIRLYKLMLGRIGVRWRASVLSGITWASARNSRRPDPRRIRWANATSDNSMTMYKRVCPLQRHKKHSRTEWTAPSFAAATR